MTLELDWESWPSDVPPPVDLTFLGPLTIWQQHRLQGLIPNPNSAGWLMVGAPFKPSRCWRLREWIRRHT